MKSNDGHIHLPQLNFAFVHACLYARLKIWMQKCGDERMGWAQNFAFQFYPRFAFKLKSLKGKIQFNNCRSRFPYLSCQLCVSFTLS